MWISCAEKLPEKNGLYTVLYNVDGESVVCLQRYTYFGFTHCFGIVPTHWYDCTVTN